ncbi:MAG: ParA family protein [Thermoguttaceae bacterium]|nr:ParA family protein [Thermoguttaceae bacterium]
MSGATALERIIKRQSDIAVGNFEAIQIDVPKHRVYSVCNLRGGVGKTTLTFNLSYYADSLLAIDLCPQGNLSYFFDKEYYLHGANIRDALLPYLIPGMPSVERIASYVGATNQYFDGKNVYYIPSSNELYLLPSVLNSALNLTDGGLLDSTQRLAAISNALFSLRKEIKRETTQNGLDKCLIDTSPFFSGGTELAWHASDALIVPVRTDRQSINSFELLIKTMQSSASFRKYADKLEGFRTPKIHAVVLTHCGWSTRSGARSMPNQQTKVYLQQCYDIMSRNRQLLSTDNPENHLFILDDFLGSGRVSSLESKPIELLKQGDTKTFDRVKVTVNAAVEKCKNELRFIHRLLW